MQGYCDKDCKKVTDGQSRGTQFQCGTCGRYTDKAKYENSEKFVDNGYTAEYVVSSEKRVTSIEEVEALCTFDRNVWQIDRWQQEAGTSEAYRKDRKVSWEVKEGKVTNGSVDDSGKILVVPLHSFKVRVWLSRKTEEIRNNLVLEDMIKKAKVFAPKYKKIKYKKASEDHLFELDLPDMQLGRLVMSESTGFELTPERQIEMADRVVENLVSYAKNFEITRCLLPIGNDFFDSNNSGNTTAHGTPMQDDVRWQRTYKLGCDFMVRTIDNLSQIAPVDVLVIPGNHDEERIFYLGEYLEAWYHNNQDVVIDNRPQKRKYYSFGYNLIGLTHGYYEKYGKLDSLMAYEVPQLWANSKFREWHLGDKHHKVDMILKTEEKDHGVVVRILRSLATPSVWEFDKGLVGSIKAGESFVWSQNRGLIAQFTDYG